MKKSFWKGKKVLVTGSEGFIGSHLVERLLSEGAKVRCFVLYNSFNNWGWLDRFSKKQLSALDIFTGDIRDSYNTKKAVQGQDIIFHLAALIAIPYSYNAPEAYIATNVSGTLNMLQAAREKGIKKFIHTSTSEVYGTARYAPIDENHPLQGQSPYSASKISADELAESFRRSFGVPVAICRPFNTYGPRQSARAVIPTIISQIVSGAKKIKLGSLMPVRDFNYVLDTVDGFLKIGESSQSVGETINIGSGRGVTIGETVDKIIQIYGKKIEVACDKARVRPDKSEVFKLICDNTKAQKLLGWKPRYSLEDGLRASIEFIRDNLDRYKPNLYNL